MTSPAPLSAQLAAILRNCPDEAALLYHRDVFKASHAQELARLSAEEQAAVQRMWTRHLARVRKAK